MKNKIHYKGRLTSVEEADLREELENIDNQKNLVEFELKLINDLRIVNNAIEDIEDQALKDKLPYRVRKQEIGKLLDEITVQKSKNF